MSLPNIITQLLSNYNKKYDENDEILNKIYEEKSNKDFNEKYNELITCCHGKNSFKYKLNESEDLDINIGVPNNKDDCDIICNLNFIQDKTFVKKIMQYRELEIKKQLMVTKYNIELYNYVCAGLLELKYKKSIGNKIDQQELDELVELKSELQEYVIKYIIFNQPYIINSTICKFDFLKERYGKLV